MTGAANHRGSSRQDIATPWDLIRAIEALLDEGDSGQGYEPFVLDLAANAGNAKAARWIGEDRNSLTVDWCAELDVGLPALEPHGAGWAFLNPPFGNIAPWAARCAAASKQGAKIALLVPASVGANWFQLHVLPFARVLFLNPRVSFDGVNPFPKDLLLALYGHPPGCEAWRWKENNGSLFAGGAG